MRLNYNPLGKYIQEINVRNSDLAITNLLGVSMEKTFIPSVANLNGVDLSVYKVLSKDQLACKLMSVGRDEKLPVDLYKDENPAIVSSAYYVFEPKDKKELLPEYLMMWLCRPENDRYIGFISGGDVRGGISWDTFCSLPIRVPHIAKQREIVKEYNTIQNRINLNNQLIQKLEETAQAIYKQWFVEFDETHLEVKTLGDLCSLITDGKHGDCVDEIKSGYYFISVKDIINGEIIYQNARQITKKDFEETHRRTNLKAGDILVTNAGTIGRMAIVRDLPETNRTTFQKSVAILKPKRGVAKTHYLFLLIKFHLKEIIDLAGGSTQSNLLLGDLRNFEIKYHGYDYVNEIENKTKPIFEMIGLKGLENQKLTELKELLLSKLATVEN